MEDIRILSKRKLKDFLYPIGHVRRGGLTCAAKALDVKPATVRQWALGAWLPSERNARRVLGWIKSEPKIVDNTGK